MDLLLLIIILVNAAFTFKGLNDYSFFERYKFNAGAVRRGEYYRLVTGAFLHAGWGHFLFNMITLYFFYKPVVVYTGYTGFLLIYFAGMIGGNLLAYYFHKNDSYYSAVGNSGAVNAVVFSAILFQPGASIFILPFPIPIPAYIYAVGYLLYTTFGMKNLKDHIGHEAHFGGAAAGIILSVLLAPGLLKQRLMLLVALLIVIIGGFIYARKKA